MNLLLTEHFDGKLHPVIINMNHIRAVRYANLEHLGYADAACVDFNEDRIYVTESVEEIMSKLL